MTAVIDHQAERPTGTLLATIRELSGELYGDPDAIFDRFGFPTDRDHASQMAAAARRMARQARKGATFGEDELAGLAVPDPDNPVTQRREETPMDTSRRRPQAASGSTSVGSAGETVTTKRCGDCETDKPLSEFGKNKATSDGLARYCRSCKAARNREYNRKRRQKAKTPDPQPRVETPPKPVVAPVGDVPGSAAGFFTDPRLSDLETIRNILTETLGEGPSFEQVADFCMALAAWLSEKGV